MTTENRKTAGILTRRERKAQRTRQRILDMAQELFENQPYDDVKMDDISEYVDLSRATLYNYFGSKEAIYFEIGLQRLRQMNERQMNAVKGEGSGLDKLLTLSGDAMRYLIEEPLIPEIIRRYLVANAQAKIPSHVVIGRMNVGNDEEDTQSSILASFLQGMREFEELWVTVIEKGHKDGSIQLNLDSEKLTHYLFMVILGMIDRINLEKVVLQRLKFSNEKIIQQTVDMISKHLTK